MRLKLVSCRYSGVHFNSRNALSALSSLHDHKETKYLLLFSLIYIQTMMKQSLCLDNDGSTIETSDSISFNFSTEILWIIVDENQTVVTA